MMKLRILRIAALVALWLPMQVSATQFSLTIDGVDPAGPGFVPVSPIPLQPGVFVGLGNCTSPGAPPSGSDPLCNGAAENNPASTTAFVDSKNAADGTNYTYAIIFGYARPMDQVIFHQLAAPILFDDTGAAPPSVEQTFDFVVGHTGRYTSGPGPIGVDQCSSPSNPQVSWAYPVDLGRSVTITNVDPLSSFFGTSLTYLISQTAEHCVGFVDADFLTIDASAVETISLGLIGGTSVQVQLGGHVQVTAGDPGISVTVNPTAVPAPSALSLFGAALACMMGVALVGRRRQLIPAKIKA